MIVELGESRPRYVRETKLLTLLALARPAATAKVRKPGPNFSEHLANLEERLNNPSPGFYKKLNF